MATGNGTSPVVAPSSIHIDINQFEKEPHHCKFEDCQNERRGYNDFCREHKAIGKIISGRIAREKAKAKIAARDKTNHAIEVDPSLPTPIKPHQGLDILSLIGILIIISSFLIYLSSISTTGWFVPTVPDWTDTMCISSVSVGTGLILFNQVLDRKNSKSVEAKKQELAVATSNNVSIKLNQFNKKESHVCIFGDCKKGKRGYSNFCREHKAMEKITAGKIARQKAIEKIAARDTTDHPVEVNHNPSEPDVNETPLKNENRIVVMISGLALILYAWFGVIPETFHGAESPPFWGCCLLVIGSSLMASAVRGFWSILFVVCFIPVAFIYGWILYLDAFLYG